MYSMMFSGSVYSLISIVLLNSQIEVLIINIPINRGKKTCLRALNSRFFLFLVPIHVMQMRTKVHILL